MKIAITVDPELPVPPPHYGGIERVVHLLLEGLATRGHQVALLANGQSNVSCDLLPYPGYHSHGIGDLVRNTWHTSSYLFRHPPDIVHSFGRLSYLLPVLPTSVPKIMSYQRIITERSVLWGERLARGTLYFTGCSAHLIRKFKSHSNFRVVYNAVSERAYRMTASVSSDAPLMFLGRIEEIKGPHLAIAVARQCGRKLILAGNVSEGIEHERFFDEHIKPFLDNHQVRYVGAVGDVEKNHLLGQSAALLMPVLWDEPFGIVMAEALACGTPVIGLNRGAVPEVVQDGINGFVCASKDEMVAAVQKLPRIDRTACRRIMLERFSDRALVDSFENLYREIALAPAK